MSLPIDFINRTRTLLGKDFDLLESALKTDAPISIRINKQKGILMPKIGTPVPWCESGYYLPERLSFTFDPLFHAGAYYVQEASSMFLEQAIRQYVTSPIRCLDLCAAPGGKSTHLASLLPAGSLLVSNEVIRSRSYVLAENIAKWGRLDTIVINNDPTEIGELTHLFDVIVTDVPCSGEGMFRKDTDSTGEWSVDNVHLCASRQRRIIHDIWNALKPGGILIYSTCTYNTEEDEENIHYIIEELGAEALPIPTPNEWDITGSLKFNHPAYRFFPHKTQGEGFFLAVLRKAEGEIDEINVNKPKGKKEKGSKTPTIPKEAQNFLVNNDQFTMEWHGEELRAYPKTIANTVTLLTNKRLRILSAGVRLGELKGKDLIPAQELALSTALNPNIFPTVELTWEEAIKYLRKEAICLSDEIDKGYVLVRYQGFPLGFVKHLGNRANNLYPQEWRIRTSYQPNLIKLFSQE